MLAAHGRSGSGPLTQQEAGLLLWHHTACGEDDAVLGTNAVSTCLDVLSASTASPADKSTAAGLLHALCCGQGGSGGESAATKPAAEQIARSKASGPGGASCCQVLHGCITDPDSVPRGVVALLAGLVGCPQGVHALLKAAAGGGVPWKAYDALLAASHSSGRPLDHTTAVDACTLIQRLVAGRAGLAVDAASAGLLPTLLDCMRCHKSAVAVAAAASCLCALCQAAPEVVVGALGGLPGAVQQIVDLLGPPPAAVVSWEREQLEQQQRQQQQQQAAAQQQQQALASRAAGGAHDQGQQAQLPRQQQGAGTRPPLQGSSTNGSSSGEHTRLSEVRGNDSSMRSSRGSPRPSGQVGSSEAPLSGGDKGPGPSSLKVLHTESTTDRTRRKSLRILDPPDEAGAAACLSPEPPGAITRHKSSLGCLRHQATTTSSSRGPLSARSGSSSAAAASSVPALAQPLLGANSCALKWEGPVRVATRAAVACLLSQLVRVPQLCSAARDRLAAWRLARLLAAAMPADASGKSGSKKGAKKQAGGSLADDKVPAEAAEALLTAAAVSLQFLSGADNADCFRIAATLGALQGLAQLALGSSNTRLRRASKAVVAQVAQLSEAQAFVEQAQVPAELLVLPRGLQAGAAAAPPALVALSDAQIRQLAVECPDSCLQPLDEVVARARAAV